MAIFTAKVLVIHPNFVKITHCCRVKAPSMIQALQEITMHYCSRGVIASIEVDNLHAKFRSEYFREASAEPRVKHLH